ncbi:MAG: lytic transglycosylase domain-containing protein [Pseudomonadota bacterium]|nr:lytic transglycosylase domain-containing protein [Pseudomonadota bacterium]
MKNAKTHHHCLREKIVAAVTLTAVLMMIVGYATQLHGAPDLMDSPLIVPETGDALPALLSDSDASYYKDIFAAQKKAEWRTADRSIKHLNNKLLMGNVLAERYLSLHYHASPAQLADWLDHYGDLPQAGDIYKLASAHAAKAKIALPPLHRQAVMTGYGDDAGLDRRADAAYDKTWQAGLAAWRKGDKAKAADYFSRIANHTDRLSPWTASEAAYWSWRAYDALGNHREATHYLRLAAAYPRNFYGILARRQLHESLNINTDAATLSENDILELISVPAARRAVALAQVGQIDLADRELRARFPQADEHQKWQLLALAHQLGLASVQIGMAKELEGKGHSLDYARYPVPRWQPQDGFTVDPALIFAFMRQESGFHASAVSSGGALGLMQLMPKTARLMQRATDVSGNATDPVTNVTLGQSYVQHLLNNPLVEGNMVYLFAAYNAGPGRLQEWKHTLHADSDPLLFVESIPNAQTRNYVKQVLANYWIYSAMAGTTGNDAYALIGGQWPSYDGYIAPVASRDSGEHNG